jgi:hypothetical protein
LALLFVMMWYKHPEGKLVIIGGGIANVTDVAATFHWAHPGRAALRGQDQGEQDPE